jgi:glycosyltransferase involved in cell wall biosynthesis
VAVIGVAARLVPMKGLEYLVAAVAELHRRGLSCQLRIAGEGPSRSAVENLVSALNIPDRVSLLGEYKEMPQFYRSLDVFALPSVSTEGLPLSVLEAMSTGLPVVSTLISGIPEAVVDGVTGTLVPARDANALADALEPLVRSRAQRDCMGQAGRYRAETQFSLERMTAEVAALYRDVAVPVRTA